ncbi:MAG: hypothetical protein P8N72_09065 [Flavimaricola sp.]|nr:hypothetical protein [Flavimaricola sp.]
MAKFLLMFTTLLFRRTIGLVIGVVITAILGRGQRARRTRQGVNLVRRLTRF